MSLVRVRCPIKAGLHQSGTSWYPVITASIYKVSVLIMSLINYVTHKYKNTTQNTPHKTTQAPHNTPHKTSTGEGLQSLIYGFMQLGRYCHKGKVTFCAKNLHC